MKNQVNVMQYDCYRKASEEQKMKMGRDYIYDLEEIQSLSMRDEMRQFVEERCQHYALSTVIRDLARYRICVQFLNELGWESILHGEESEIELELLMKKYLLKNGFALVQQRKRSERGIIAKKKSDKLEYVLLFYRYWKKKMEKPISEAEKDIWDVRKLEHVPMINPVKPGYTLNFSQIKQDQIRVQIKSLMLYECEYKQYSTIRRDLKILVDFFSFLYHRNSMLKKLEQINRDEIEAYLIYLKTESGHSQTYYSEIIKGLRRMLRDLGMLNELPHLGELILSEDAICQGHPDPKPYSDAEIRRFNEALVRYDLMTARVLFIHELLGTRIEDTLLLTKDCLFKKGEHDFITIRQRKTRTYTKPISESTAEKIRKLIEIANEKYPDSNYIFLREDGQLISYNLVQYRINKMIYTEKLRDDQGELFVFRSHRFRHTYGTKLAEMDFDDMTIARLLGHKDTRSVAHYRKIRNMELAKKTAETRKALDEVLVQFKEARDGEVRQNGGEDQGTEQGKARTCDSNIGRYV